MRAWQLIVQILAAGLLGFGWWGSATAAGMRMFDEMAGILPFVAGLLGAFLLVVSSMLSAWLWWHDRG
jgi:hypothetical protein